MSLKVMSWVWDHSRSRGTDRLVLLAIADSADDNGDQAWPSTETLSRKTGVDTRTVQRSIRRLVDAGELDVRWNAGKHGVNVYRVTMTPGTAPPRPSATPAQRHPGTAPPHNSDETESSSQEPPADCHPRRSATPAICRETPGNLPPKPSMNHPRDVSTQEANASFAETRPRSKASASSNEDPKPWRDDVERICVHLADRIEANGSKRPTIGKGWRDSARLLIDRDGRTEPQIHTAIDWSQDHDFWRATVLSMPTLRAKYDQMRLQASRNGSARASPKQPYRDADHWNDQTLEPDL